MGGVGDLIEGNYARDGYYGFNNNRDCSYQDLGYNYSTSEVNYITITNGSLENLAAGDVVSFSGVDGSDCGTGVAMPAPLLGGHAYFIGANVPGTNEWELFDSQTDALAGTNYIPLTQVTNGSGTLEIARYSTADAPAVLMNNWTINITWGNDCAPCTFFDAVSQNLQDGVLAVPGHIRTLFEYNRIINFNATGAWYGWDWAAMGKGFGCVQNVYCYNEWDGGTGLGVWLDTDNFDNRFDGNLFLNIDSAGINVEASPGPNLMCNNIIVANPDDNGGDIASWSSNQEWVVNNTLMYGEAYYSTVSINTSADGQRYSPWNIPDPTDNEPVWSNGQDARQAYVNNLLLDIDTALDADTNPSTPDLVANNYTDNAADVTVAPYYTVGQSATADYLSDAAMALEDPSADNFSLTAASSPSLTNGGYTGSLSDASGAIGLTAANVTTNTITLNSAMPQYVAVGNYLLFSGSVPTGITAGKVYQILACPTASTSFTLQDPANPGVTVSVTGDTGGNFDASILMDSTLAAANASGLFSETGNSNSVRLASVVTLPSAITDGDIAAGNLVQFTGNAAAYGLETGQTYTISDVVTANQSFTLTSGGWPVAITANPSGGSLGIEFSTNGGSTWKDATQLNYTEVENYGPGGAIEYSGGSPYLISSNYVVFSVSGSGNSLPGGLTAGEVYQINSTPWSEYAFTLTDTSGNPITLTDTGSGTFSMQAWQTMPGTLGNFTVPYGNVTSSTITLSGTPTAPQAMPYDYVVFTGGNLPGGVTAGYDYQIMSCSNNTTFTLMDLYGNPITLSPPSSGSFTFTIYSQAPGATGAIGLGASSVNTSAGTITLPTANTYASFGNFAVFSGAVPAGLTAGTVYQISDQTPGCTYQQSFTLSNPATGDQIDITGAGGNFSVTFLAGDPSAAATVSDLVTTDFDGLLRFPSDGNSVGAMRAYHDYTSTTLEVQFTNGTTERLANWHSLSARWTFDQGSGTTAANSSGNGLTAALQGGASWAAGEIGDALSLSGTGQYASVPANGAFDVSSTTAFTISAWVQLSGTINNNSTYYPIISDGSSGNYWGLSLCGNGATVYNGVYLNLDGAVLKPTVNESSVFNNHAWHLVTATLDGSGDGYLYVDGVLVGSATGISAGMTKQQWTSATAARRISRARLTTFGFTGGGQLGRGLGPVRRADGEHRDDGWLRLGAWRHGNIHGHSRQPIDGPAADRALQR